MFPRKRPSSCVFVVLIAGCSPSLPGTLVGESAHFRLFIDPDLDPSTLVHAYRSGVFPWFGEGDPILWWSPDPRAVFEHDGLRVSRRLARTRASTSTSLPSSRSTGWISRTRCFAVSSRSSNKSSIASERLRVVVSTACADFHWFMPSVRPR